MSEPFAQRDPGQPTRNHLDPVAAEHEWPEVDVAGLQAPPDVGGMGRELDDLLRDVAVWVGLYFGFDCLERWLIGGAPDHDPVATGLPDRLHDQFPHPVQDDFEVIGVPGEVGGHIGKGRLLAQVVTR